MLRKHLKVLQKSNKHNHWSDVRASRSHSLLQLLATDLISFLGPVSSFRARDFGPNPPLAATFLGFSLAFLTSTFMGKCPHFTVNQLATSLSSSCRLAYSQVLGIKVWTIIVLPTSSLKHSLSRTKAYLPTQDRKRTPWCSLSNMVPYQSTMASCFVKFSALALIIVDECMIYLASLLPSSHPSSQSKVKMIMGKELWSFHLWKSGERKKAFIYDTNHLWKQTNDCWDWSSDQCVLTLTYIP